MGSACGTCTNRKTFASFIDGDISIPNEAQPKSSDKNCESDEVTHSFIRDGITQFPIGKDELAPKVHVSLIASSEATISSYYNEIEHNESFYTWDNISKRIEDTLRCTGARPSVKWSSDSTEVSGTRTPLGSKCLLKITSRPSIELNDDSPDFTSPICQFPASSESTSVHRDILDQVQPLSCPAKNNLTSTGQGTNDDAKAYEIFVDLHVSDRNGGKEVNMISSQDGFRYKVPSKTETEFRKSGGEVYGIMCWDLCWFRGDDGNDPTDYYEKMCVAERLKSPGSISPAFKYTTTLTSEMWALKRTLADAYIEAMPSSYRNIRLARNAVDNIWKEVTTIIRGERVLLRDRYLEEVARLRSRKEGVIDNIEQSMLSQSTVQT